MVKTYGRITVPEVSGPGAELTVEGAAFDSLALWRARPGEAMTVTTTGGRTFRARITTLGTGSADLLVFEETAPHTGPGILLLQALPQRERMELVIEKTTELGVSVVQPFESERSITMAERDSGQRKSHRWQARALKAARQSRRPDIPLVNECIDIDRALAAATGCGIKILLSEATGARPIREALARAGRGGPATDVAIMTGPEGGLTPGEVERAAETGFTAVSLGPGVLRTETASILAVGIVTYELG